MGHPACRLFPEEVRDAAIAHGYLRPEMVVGRRGQRYGLHGCGAGPAGQPGVRVDGSAAMLERRSRNLAGFDNVEIRRDERASPPLPDASLDAVFANMYLHHCPDPAAAIGEMARVLKPGGRLVITDMDATTMPGYARRWRTSGSGSTPGAGQGVAAGRRPGERDRGLRERVLRGVAERTQRARRDRRLRRGRHAAGNRREQAVRADYGAMAQGAAAAPAVAAQPVHRRPAAAEVAESCAVQPARRPTP